MHFIPFTILTAFALCHSSLTRWAPEVHIGKEGLSLSDLNKGCHLQNSGIYVWTRYVETLMTYFYKYRKLE